LYQNVSLKPIPVPTKTSNFKTKTQILAFFVPKKTLVMFSFQQRLVQNLFLNEEHFLQQKRSFPNKQGWKMIQITQEGGPGFFLQQVKQ
jgi:hypothetical protein